MVRGHDRRVALQLYSMNDSGCCGLYIYWYWQLSHEREPMGDIGRANTHEWIYFHIITVLV